MAGSLIIEVLSSAGEVRSRTRLTELPAVIGRSYESDVILDDPFVSPRHVRISRTESGELIAEDLGSVNGTIAHGAKVTGSHPFGITSGAVIRLGRTTVRVVQSDHPVGESPLDVRSAEIAPRPARAMGARAAALLATAISVGVLAVDSHLGTWERETPAEAVGTGLVILLALMVWAGLWSLVGRMVVHRFRFLEHLAMVAVVAAAMTLLTTASEWIDFVGPAAGVSDLFSVGGSLVLASALLFAHLTLATAASRRSVVQGTLGVCLGIAALFAFIGYAEREQFTTAMTYSSTLKPLDERWLRPISVEEFAGNTEKLKAEVDRMAAKSVP